MRQQDLDAMTFGLSSAPSLLAVNPYRYVMDTGTSDHSRTSGKFESLLRSPNEFHPKSSTLRVIRSANSSRPYYWKDSSDRRKSSIDHSLRALASEDVLPTSPKRISRKLNALRGQLASAPSTLHGNLHSGCYEALFKSGDITSRRPKLTARALSMRSGTSLRTPRSALAQSSHTCHNTPVFYQFKTVNPSRPRTPRSRPSTAGTAAAAAPQGAVTRERLRSAPAALYSDYNLRAPSACLNSPRGISRRIALEKTGKLHQGLPPRPCSALKMPLSLEQEQLRARRPIKSVTFSCTNWSSPYNSKMSNRARKLRSFNGLNYTGVTGADGVCQDFRYMEMKAKNSVQKAVGLSAKPFMNGTSELHLDALKVASDLVLISECLGAQQAWCARLGRSLYQQKGILRLIKRTQGRRSFTSENIMCECSNSTIPVWGTRLARKFPA